MPTTVTNPGFSPRFYENIGARGAEAEAAATPGAALNAGAGSEPAYYDKSEHNSFRRFMSHPDFERCKQQYNDTCHAFQDKLKDIDPVLSARARTQVENFLGTINGPHLGANQSVLFDNGKRALETIVKHMDDPALPVETKKRILEDVCRHMNVCAPGVASRFQMAAQNLVLGAHSQAGEIQLAKEELINALTLDFIKQNYPRAFTGDQVGSQIHYRACLCNHIADTAGIAKQDDAYVESILERGVISRDGLDKYTAYIAEHLTPAGIAGVIADKHLGECAALMEEYLGPGQYSASLAEYGECGEGELQRRMDDKVQELQKNYGVRSDDILAYSFEDVEESCSVVGDSTCLTGGILQGMHASGFIPEPIAIASRMASPGTSDVRGGATDGRILAVDDLTWAEAPDGSRLALDIHHPALRSIDPAQYPGVIANVIDKSSGDEIRAAFPDPKQFVHHEDIMGALIRKMGPGELDAYLGVAQEQAPVRDSFVLSLGRRFRQALDNFVARRLTRVSPAKAEVLLKFVSGSALNSQDPETGDSLLHRAVRENNMPIARVLLKHGIARDLVNKGGQSAHSLAMKTGRMELAGAVATPEQARGTLARHDVTEAKKQKYTISLLACSQDAGVVDALLKDSLLDVGRTCTSYVGEPLFLLQAAVRNPNPDIFHTLVKAGARPVDELERVPNSYLHCITPATPESIRQEIIDLNRANINVVSKRGYSPIHAAARGGSPEVIRAMIEAGADVNKVSESSGKTPLQLAEAGARARREKLSPEVRRLLTSA